LSTSPRWARAASGSGLGDSDPRVSDATAAGRARNRRVDLTITHHR
jgi:flagellar motor protein MotB